MGRRAVTMDAMKTIGLVGGMSWHSTATYYRLINEQVAARLGGHASARISLQSLDFADVRDCQVRGDWAGSAQLLADATRRCVAGGADLVGLCTNLMHKNFAALEAAAAESDVPPSTSPTPSPRSPAARAGPPSASSAPAG